jgi:histidinol-phosphate/aromatic aminotransferase/cobyric acid decarboxylase-like protein
MTAGFVAPEAGPHGGDGERLARLLGVPVDDVLDLSASLNPCTPPTARVVARHLEALGRYPDPRRATVALAEAMGVAADRLLLCNGGSEAIALVASMMPVGSVADPEFSLYRRHLREVRSDAPSWRSDPHNPTGALAALDQTDAVRDEAFYPLTIGCWTRGDADAIVLGSLTKLWACPGLRLGYVLVPDDRVDLVSELASRQPAWSVSGLASGVLPELLGATDLPAWASRLAALRRDLVDLVTSHGLAPALGQAPYVWIPEAAGLRDRLASCGVLVRSGASFGHPDAVRIAVVDERGLERLADAFERTSGGVGDIT